MTSIIGTTSCKLSHPHDSTHSHSDSVQRGYGFQIFMRSSTNADVYYNIIEEYLYPAIIAAQDVIKKKGVTNLILYDKIIMKIENVHFSYYRKKCIYWMIACKFEISSFTWTYVSLIQILQAILHFFGRKRNEKLE